MQIHSIDSRIPRYAAGYRPCIRCRKPFASAHCGHRLCARCTGTASGYDDEHTAAVVRTARGFERIISYQIEARTRQASDAAVRRSFSAIRLITGWIAPGRRQTKGAT